MSTSANLLAPEQESSQPEKPLPWLTAAWFLALLIVAFFPVLRPMVQEWIDMEEMGHAFFVPLVAGYVVWNERKEIMSLPVRPNYWALLLVVWGFIQMLLGFLGADFFIARTAFLMSLFGVCWTLLGTAIMRKLLFPFFLLLFMIRIPLFIYQQITFPLQLFASSVAEHALNFIGIPVLRDGNILELPSQRLSVVEACSGIRSLLSLSFLSLAYGYMFESRLWMRVVLFIATTPIAIVANASRVTLTGILSEYKKELATGVYHSFEGWVIFVIALAALFLLHKTLTKLTVRSHA